MTSEGIEQWIYEKKQQLDLSPRDPRYADTLEKILSEAFVLIEIMLPEIVQSEIIQKKELELLILETKFNDESA